MGREGVLEDHAPRTPETFFTPKPYKSYEMGKGRCVTK